MGWGGDDSSLGWWGKERQRPLGPRRQQRDQRSGEDQPHCEATCAPGLAQAGRWPDCFSRELAEIKIA